LAAFTSTFSGDFVFFFSGKILSGDLSDFISGFTGDFDYNLSGDSAY
jgi:hypothetical protein